MFAFNALLQNTTGTNNTALGFESLYTPTTAANNTAADRDWETLGRKHNE